MNDLMCEYILVNLVLKPTKAKK